MSDEPTLFGIPLKPVESFGDYQPVDVVFLNGVPVIVRPEAESENDEAGEE